MKAKNRDRVPGSSEKKNRYGRHKKRKHSFYGYKLEQQVTLLKSNPSTAKDSTQQPTVKISRSRQKLKSLKNTDAGPTTNRIIDISILFPALKEFLACKFCGNSVQFTEENVQGLGSQIKISCTSCPKFININTSRRVGTQNNAFEVNRRALLGMRNIGLGHAGLSSFCGVMDFLPPVAHSNFDIINEKLHKASDIAAKASMKAAMEEDCSSETQDDDHETVSGDGSWRKRGFSSLQGVATLIRNANGKVIDVCAKHAFCKACDNHPQEDTEAYKDWLEQHEKKCPANHEGSSGKMEVDGISKMFKRSEETYGVKYKNYIGDGDSKVYKSLCDSNPYGENFKIIKKECIQHVQKRMGTRLRNLKKSLSGKELSDHGSIGGKDRLTANRIDKLTKYYGNAIRKHNSSVADMSNAIWATFYHVQSTDKKPTHHLCPSGTKSWCKWQVAKANKKLKEFRHKDIYPAAIMTAIKPVYDDLTNSELLERCIGGYTQNSNESFNQNIWKIVPKHSFSGLTVLEIGVNIAVCSFNDGKVGLLQIMKNFDVEPGSSAVTWAKNIDNERILRSDKRASEATLEARQAKRKKNNPKHDFYSAGAY